MKYCSYCSQFVDEDFFHGDMCEDCYYNSRNQSLAQEEEELTFHGIPIIFDDDPIWGGEDD